MTDGFGHTGDEKTGGPSRRKGLTMPLTFDLPLEKLPTYAGTNPRPADFDEFWARGLAELDALDPAPEFQPAEFQTAFARCRHLVFRGTRGGRVYAKLLEPANARAGRPAVVQFHGYSGNSGDWAGKLGLVAQGFTVAAMDVRGQGGRSWDAGGQAGTSFYGHFIRGLDGPPDEMLFRQVFLDTALLARIVMGLPGVDPRRVACAGASQGGGLALACAALEPRVARCAAAYPFLSDYQRVWKMDQDVGAYKELRDYFRLFDPTHARETEVFTKLGYIDVQHLAPRIRAEVLMATALRDTICPPSTQYAAYNKIAAKKTMVHYPDFGHEGLPGHEDRVFQFLAAM